jgi:hypothetical protein
MPRQPECMTVTMADMVSRLLRLGAVFFALNLAWESLQIPLYTTWSERWPHVVSAVLHCTVGDLLIGAVVLAFALAIAGRRWPAERPARRRIAVLTTLAGVAYTVFSEWLNVDIRQSWAYSGLMPRLPPLGTGLTPVLQWLVLPPLALHVVLRDRGPGPRPAVAEPPRPESRRHVP